MGLDLQAYHYLFASVQSLACCGSAGLLSPHKVSLENGSFQFPPTSSHQQHCPPDQFVRLMQPDVKYRNCISSPEGAC